MTLGAIALMALGNNAPSAGPFCLANYYRLDSLDKILQSQAPQSPNRWSTIEIYYSGTQTGNIAYLASLRGLASPEDINCHFCLSNGLGGLDGQIEASEKWLKQWSVTPSQAWYGSNQTIRICAIADGRTHRPTDCQIKRVEALVERLCRKFAIAADSVYYPSDWR
jgi:hypothetical protein